MSYDGKSKPVAADNLQVKNDSECFQELLTWMRERGIRRSSLVVGLEHTGIYSMDISLFLESEQHASNVHLITASNVHPVTL